MDCDMECDMECNMECECLCVRECTCMHAYIYVCVYEIGSGPFFSEITVNAREYARGTTLVLLLTPPTLLKTPHSSSSESRVRGGYKLVVALSPLKAPTQDGLHTSTHTSMRKHTHTHTHTHTITHTCTITRTRDIHKILITHAYTAHPPTCTLQTTLS